MTMLMGMMMDDREGEMMIMMKWWWHGDDDDDDDDDDDHGRDVGRNGESNINRDFQDIALEAKHSVRWSTWYHRLVFLLLKDLKLRFSTIFWFLQ